MTTFGTDADVRRMVAAWEAGWGVLTVRDWAGFVVIPAGVRVAKAIEHPAGSKWDDGGWIAWS